MSVSISDKFAFASSNCFCNNSFCVCKSVDDVVVFEFSSSSVPFTMYVNVVVKQISKIKTIHKFLRMFTPYTFKYFLIEITLPKAPIPIPNNIYTTIIDESISLKLTKFMFIICINFIFTAS